jgi:ABC-type dipeptide/oligopeptide/nickel transport system ATPase component
MEISDTQNEQLGAPIGIILSKKNGNKFIYVKDGNSIKSFTCEVDKVNKVNIETVQQIPCVMKERDVVYCSGMSGSGKSYYIKNFAQYYQKLYKGREIYVFSGIQEDAGSLDQIKDLKRVKIFEEGFLESQFSLEDFKDSLVIFDDLEMISDKPLKTKIMKLQHSMLCGGRHKNISLCVANHSVANGAETKLILNEATTIVLYCKGLGTRVLKYVLDQYLGQDKATIKKITKLESRWISIIKTYPQICLYETGGFVLNTHDED